MLRKSILVVVSAMVVGLVALASIAVAGMATDDTGALTEDALVMASTTTTMADDGDAHGDVSMASTTTTTTMADDGDAHGDVSMASTTTTTVDDDEYDDDEYDDDEYDDDGSVPNGVETIDVSPAGSITVEVGNGMLHLTAIDIDSNWMLAKRDEQSEQFELLFYWGESELKIKVEIDSGYLKKMIEFDMKDD